MLVTHSSKNSIENHFDTSFELEAMLEKRVKRQLLDEVQSICPPHVTIMQVRQGLAKGLGHAVLCAHPVVGDEPVAVILPDVILDEYEMCIRDRFTVNPVTAARRWWICWRSTSSTACS